VREVERAIEKPMKNAHQNISVANYGTSGVCVFMEKPAVHENLRLEQRLLSYFLPDTGCQELTTAMNGANCHLPNKLPEMH
jgi:hypothetical protein